MANYREVPWKRNLRKVPDTILADIKALKTDGFNVSVTKTFSAANLESSVFDHLSLPDDSEELSSVTPPREMGPFSTKNVDGWEVVRRDLPKIKKTFYWETPNFGDAATYGTHLHFHDREVYQREFHEPRFYSIISRLLRRDKAGAGGLFQISVEQPLDRTVHGFEDELLFHLNLLQENCGSVGIIGTDATKDEIIATTTLDWEVFPPGTVGDIVKALSSGKKMRESKAGIVEERVKLFSLLKPKSYLKGNGGFGSYIGAQYADDLVVFENLEYGNALYILYADWQEISKRSRIDLIRGTDATFDRLPHTYGWEQAFGRIMKREKRKRGL